MKIRRCELLVPLVVGLFACGPTTAGHLPTVAKHVVTLLSQRDYAAVETTFDDTLKQALPEGKLRQAWEAATTQVGPFRKLLSTRAKRVTESGTPYDVVVVTCQFQKRKLDVKVVFHASRGKVTGLFFLPSRS